MKKFGAGKMNVDPEALHKKYLLERDKRLRSDGTAQYIDMVGELAAYAADPYLGPDVDRAPATEQVDVLIVGGGVSGLLLAARLRHATNGTLRIIEKGGDFGGTWYWNRYPGLRCDVESYIYMPLLEELGNIPTEKYATGQEIFFHCRALASHFGLYADTFLRTAVTAARWNADSARWLVETNRGDRLEAKFLCLGTGGLSLPKLPGIKGILDFKGRAFHTSRWDYDYTGGSPRGDLVGLRGKRVALIGTGATSIQCLPALAESAQEVIVFQRTPPAVDFRNNKPTDPDWASALQPGWQKDRMVNFSSILQGLPVEENLVADRWTDIWTTLAGMGGGEGEDDGTDLMQLADYKKMEELRSRIDAVVDDPRVAERLKPYYNLFCKRPLFSDEFLQTFNRSNVTLIDTDGRGVDRITETSVIVGADEYPVDCIVFATGFRVGVPCYEAGGFRVVGRDGIDLSNRWADGVRTLHGIHVHGFPNLFIVGSRTHAALSPNFTHFVDEQSDHIAQIVARCLDEHIRTVEVLEAAEDMWAQMMAAVAVDRATFYEECTPSYLNNEGATDRPSYFGAAYHAGLLAYVDVCNEWRKTGFERDLDIVHEPQLSLHERPGELRC